MAKQNRPHKSASQLRKETDNRLFWLVIFGLIVIGGGVIFGVYGGWGLATAVPVLIFGAFLIFIPFLTLLMIQRWRDNLEQKAWQEAQEWEAKQKSLPVENNQEASAKEGANSVSDNP